MNDDLKAFLFLPVSIVACLMTVFFFISYFLFLSTEGERLSMEKEVYLKETAIKTLENFNRRGHEEWLDCQIQRNRPTVVTIRE